MDQNPVLGFAAGDRIGGRPGGWRLQRIEPVQVPVEPDLSGKGEQERKLQSLQSQLTATTQQLDQTKQQLASDQQNNTQMTSQMSDLQKSSDAASSQLTGARNELASAKTQL